MQTSRHAQIRMQQRGIPEQIVRNIIAYGSTRRVAGGAIARFMSKKDLKALLQTLPKKECIELDKHKGIYVVMDNSHVITVGHRTRRFYR